MKIKFSIIFLTSLTFAAILGGSIVFIYLHKSENIPSNKAITFTELLKFSNKELNKNSCWEEQINTVGDVVGDIFERNQTNKVNRTDFDCTQEYCWLSISSCYPWQSSECDSRILRFELENDKQIDASSFECFDVP